jgi:acetolactate synthase-1/2/3 large subunit
MAQTAAKVVVDTLAAHGTDVIYCVPGESFLPITDALIDVPGIELVVCRHEGGAGFMALAHARIRNEPAVCMVSRGPGAMNAAIALHVAFHDAEPVVFLVGQAERARLGRMALQEMNYSKTFSDTAKLVIEVIEPDRVGEAIARAMHVARAGTPGPVVVVLPEDLLYGPSDSEVVQPVPAVDAAPSNTAIEQASAMLAAAQRPIVISGGRVHGPEALAQLTAFSERYMVPVLPAHRRLHTFDSSHPHCAGRLTNRAPAPMMELLRTSDLVIVLGERLGPSVSQGFSFPRAPIPEQPMIHVWPDAEELGRVWHPTLGIACEPQAFLQAMLAGAPRVDQSARGEWIGKLNEVHRDLSEWKEVSANDGVVFGRVTREVDKHLADDAIVTYDAGNFSSWVNRFINLTQQNMFIGATVGAMGAGIPSGVAAGICAPGRQVVTFVGDGGALMTGNELATAMHYGVDMKLFVSNNATYGTIRMHQARSFPGRKTSTQLTNPDFAAWGESFGARGFRIETDQDVPGVVAAVMNEPGLAVVDVRTSLSYISAGGTLEAIELAARR